MRVGTLSDITKYLLFSSLLLMIISCTPPRYVLISHEELKNEITLYGKLPVKRYLLTPAEYENQKLPFIESELSKSIVTYLKKGDVKGARNYLSMNTTDDSTSVYFAQSLISFFDGNYDSCSILLEKLDDYSQNCFIQFISNDCLFEIDQRKGTVNYKEYLDKYQKVLDCSDSDELHKEIVKSRLKLIRYGY